MPLLGLRDERVYSENAGWNTNKIGGKPDWMTEGCVAPCCPHCQKTMILVVQLYCPLGGSPYHRTLYIFTCTNKPCWTLPQSWTALRCQLLDDASRSAPTVARSSNTTDQMFTMVDDWGDESDDDWGQSDNDVGNNKVENILGPGDVGTGISSLPKMIGEMVSESTSMTQKSVENTEVHKLLNSEESEYLSKLKNDLETVSNTSEEVLGNVQDVDISAMNIHDVDDESDMSCDVVQSEDNNRISEKSFRNMASLLQQQNGTAHSTDGSDMSMALAGDKPNSDNSDLQNITPSEKNICSNNDDSLVSFYLNVVDEPTEAETEDSSHIKRLLLEYQARENLDVASLMETGPGGGGTGEKYEKSEIRHGDKIFHRFMKRVSICPQQCIRYDWNGVPQYITAPTPREASMTSKGRCRSCGQEFVYELQLMPALVSSLTFANKSGPAVEFGTVIVYTCKASCWRVGDRVKQEFVVYQQDPDSHLFCK